MGRNITVIINPGERHKDWLVIKEIDKKHGVRCFLCECLNCNKNYEVQYNSLTNKNGNFCCTGCARSRSHERKADELIGKVFGRLTVISKHSAISGHWYYNCVCECGTTKIIRGNDLKTNKTTSCGCYRHEMLSGENCNFWIDGRADQNELDRTRLSTVINPIIRQRDNHTCQNCNQYNGWLEIHHIFDFSNYPELRFEENNLITLCKVCHDDFHKIYHRTSTNTLNDLENWMNKEYQYRSELLNLL